MDALSSAPTGIIDVSDAELDVIRGLFVVWAQKRRRNLKRTAYYDGTQVVKDLGISIPPQVRGLDAVLGWPAKAVRALAQRNIWDGFVTPGQAQDPFELLDVLEQNNFDLELPQAITSAYKHSVSFITTTKGDTASGDPDVLVMPRSAEWSAATWDKNRRRVSAFLAITDTTEDQSNRILGFTAYLPDVVLVCVRAGSGWVASRQRNPIGRVLVEALPYDPQLERPFGHSRISRAVMSITDRAARTLLRMELHAEFFSAPQRYVLGVSDTTFEGKDKWDAYIGRFNALTKDEDGDVPKIQELSASSPQPHIDMLRAQAALFSGETGLALSSLGIVQDNPSSADAIYAAKEDLIVEAQQANRVFGGALKNVARKIVMLRDGLSEPLPEMSLLQANWRNPSFPSPVSAADALSKVASVFPWLGDSEVALEHAGFTQSEITRLLSDKARGQASSTLQTLLARAPEKTVTDDNAG